MSLMKRGMFLVVAIGKAISVMRSGITLKLISTSSIVRFLIYQRFHNPPRSCSRYLSTGSVSPLLSFKSALSTGLRLFVSIWRGFSRLFERGMIAKEWLDLGG